MGEKEPRNYLFIALVGVLILVSLAFVFMPQKKSEAWTQSEASKKATTTKVATIPLVAFIGDSICAGAADELKAHQRWPQMVSQQLKWFPYNACVGGSGYINPGPDGKSTYQLVFEEFSIKLKPAIIVVEGGQNDLFSVTVSETMDATEISKAACGLYALIRKDFPKAQLIVMTPFYGVSQAPPSMKAEENAIMECAAKYNAKVISGVRKWLQDRPELVIADQTHPNGAGHSLIAQKFVAWYKANGFKA